MGETMTDEELLSKLNKNISDDDLLSKLNSSKDFATQSKNLRGQMDLQSQYPTKMQSFGIGAKTNLKGLTQGLEQIAQSLVAPGMMTAPFQNSNPYEQQDIRRAQAQELNNRAMANRQQYADSKDINPWSTMGGSLSVDLGLGAIPGGTAARGASAPSKGMSYLQTIKQGAAQGAKQVGIPSAILGAVPYVADEESRILNSTFSGLVGAAAGGLFGGAVSALRPTNAAQSVRGTLPDKDLVENYNAARGTETGIGSILNSPTIEKFRVNALANVPGSDVNQSIQRTGQSLEKDATKIMQGLEPEAYEAKVYGKEYLYNKINEIENNVMTEVQDNFTKLDEISKESGTGIIERTQRRNEASNIFGEISSDVDLEKNLSPEIKSYLKFIKTGVADEKAINFIINSAEESDSPEFKSALMGMISKVPNKATEGTFNNTNILRGLELQKARKYREFGEKYEAGIFNRLAESSYADMENAALNSGNPELEKQWLYSNKFYKENAVPLQDRGFTRVTSDNSSSRVMDTVLDPFIKPGARKDQVEAMKILTSRLDEEGMDVARNVYFSPALDPQGNMRPDEFLKFFNQLGPRQKQEFFRGKEGVIDQITKLEQMRKLNPEAFRTMFNPPTGQTNLSLKTLSMLSAAVATGFKIGGPLGASLAVPAVSAASNGINKLMTSPKFRESLVKSLLEGPKEHTGKSRDMADAIKAIMVGNSTFSAKNAKTAQPMEEESY